MICREAPRANISMTRILFGIWLNYCEPPDILGGLVTLHNLRVFLPVSQSGRQQLSIPRFALFVFSLLSAPGIMSVTLDNIQFYHRPSKPTKPLFLTFDSKRNDYSTPSLGPLPRFINKPVSSVTEDLITAKSDSLSLATYTEYITY